MRLPVSRMFQRTILASSSLNTLADLLLGDTAGSRRPRAAKCADHLGLGGVDRVVALLLARDRVGGAQIRLDDAEHRLLERRSVGRLKSRGSLAAFSASWMIASITGWKCAVAEHHGAEHHLLGQLLGLGLDHQHRVRGAGDDQVELALRHLVDRRVEHVLAVDEADAGGADRAHERHARERQRGGGGDHRHDVGIVLQVVRQHGAR